MGYRFNEGCPDEWVALAEDIRKGTAMPGIRVSREHSMLSRGGLLHIGSCFIPLVGKVGVPRTLQLFNKYKGTSRKQNQEEYVPIIAQETGYSEELLYELDEAWFVKNLSLQAILDILARSNGV